jgi:hypothetical protein
MQEMETLWRHVIKIMNSFIRKEFTLRAIIFVTINDYQALFASPLSLSISLSLSLSLSLC